MKSILLLLTFSLAILACDPPRLSFEKALDQFDLIFTGKALSVEERMEEVGPSLLTTFAVEDLWKGHGQKKVVIKTLQWGCSQTRFNIGERHLLFAKKRGEHWYTTAHDQHNVKLKTSNAQEALELMALHDTFRGTAYFTSDTFSTAEVAFLVKGQLTTEHKKEENGWRKKLSKKSVTELCKKRDEEIARHCNYAHNGRTFFLFKDSLMTRKEFFFSVEGNCAFRFYEIPEDWVQKLKLQSNHLIMANSSYNFYSHPKPLSDLSLSDLLLLLEKKVVITQRK